MNQPATRDEDPEMDRQQRHHQLLQQVEHLIKNKFQGFLGGSFWVEQGLQHHDLNIVSKGWHVVSQNQFEIGRCISHLFTLGRCAEGQREQCDISEMMQTVVEEVESQKARLGVVGFVHRGSEKHRCHFELLSIRSALIGLIRLCAWLEGTETAHEIILNLDQSSSTRIRLRFSTRCGSEESTASADPVEQVEDLETRLQSEALIVEWNLANYVVACHQGSLIVCQDGQRRIVIDLELPLAET